MAVDTRYVTHDKWQSLTATQVTYPNGRQVASGYDALYRRNSVTETIGGASIAQWQFFGGRTATVALGNGVTCSFMNNAQTNSAVQVGVPNPTWGNNTTDRLGYDGSGRLIAKRFLPAGSTTSLVGFTTAYDPASNKLYERALQAESRSALYPGYDSMDRLREYQRGTLASGGGSISTPITLPGTDTVRDYNLDSLGNWKSTVYTPEGGTSTTEIRQHNRLNEITQFGTTPVTYDHGNNAGNSNPLIAQRGNGNIIDDGTRNYAYDALNRLTTVTSTATGTPQIAAYTYDALGRRVLKVVTNGGVSGSIANATYRYLYGGQQITEELLFASSTYSTLRQFVWGQYIDELVQLKIPTTTTTPPLTAGTNYPLQGLLYRTSATTDSDGDIVEAYDYDAYGNTLMFSAGGTGGNWWADDAATTLQPMCENLFTGRQYDPETGIYWYRARYFSPSIGRFLGRDSFTNFEPTDYQYCESDPVVKLDPSGLVPTKKCPCHCLTADITFDNNPIKWEILPNPVDPRGWKVGFVIKTDWTFEGSSNLPACIKFKYVETGALMTKSYAGAYKDKSFQSKHNNIAGQPRGDPQIRRAPGFKAGTNEATMDDAAGLWDVTLGEGHFVLMLKNYTVQAFCTGADDDIPISSAKWSVDGSVEIWTKENGDPELRNAHLTATMVEPPYSAF